MIPGQSLEYACARVSARLAQRPDERLWLQLRSARSVPAVLEAVRTSAASSTVSGIPLTGDADVVELAFRQQLRTRIEEVAGWSPDAWRPALRYTRHLVDLPAVVHLLQDEAPPRWIHDDPQLGGYAMASRVERRAALLASPLAPIAAAADSGTVVTMVGEPLARSLRRLRVSPAVHRAVAAWEDQWRARWPHVAGDARRSIEDVVAVVRRHVLHFGALTTDDATAARHGLASRLVALLHRATVQPAALFTYLALFALDLERLRGEFVLRARSAVSS